MKKSERAPIALLIFLASLPAFSVDSYLPALPTIQETFGLDSLQIQLTLTFFFLFFALSHLILGPFSDRFGRIPVLFCGLAFYIVGSVVGFYGDSLGHLILARSLQGVGSAASHMTAMAMTRDMFRKQLAAQIFARMMSIVTLAPIFAPLLGGQLLSFFSWRAVFVFHLVLGLSVLLANLRYVKETNRNPSSIAPSEVFSKYIEILRNRTYVSYSALVVSAFAALLAFVTASPFLFIKLLNIDPGHFWMYFGFNSLALIVGGPIGIRLIRKRGMDYTIFIGLVAMFVGSMLMFILANQFETTVFTILGPMFVITLGTALILPTGASAALSPFGQNAGAAAALQGFFRYLISGAVATLIGTMSIKDQNPIAMIMLVCTSIGMISFLLIKEESIPTQQEQNPKN